MVTIGNDVFERLQKNFLAVGDDIMRNAPKSLRESPPHPALDPPW